MAYLGSCNATYSNMLSQLSNNYNPTCNNTDARYFDIYISNMQPVLIFIYCALAIIFIGLPICVAIINYAIISTRTKRMMLLLTPAAPVI